MTIPGELEAGDHFSWTTVAAGTGTAAEQVTKDTRGDQWKIRTPHRTARTATLPKKGSGSSTLNALASVRLHEMMQIVVREKADSVSTEQTAHAKQVPNET